MSEKSQYISFPDKAFRVANHRFPLSERTGARKDRAHTRWKLYRKRRIFTTPPNPRNNKGKNQTESIIWEIQIYLHFHLHFFCVGFH